MTSFRPLALVLVILSFGAGFYYYPQLPERVISHWNLAGEPNGTMIKFWGVFLFPFIGLGTFLLMQFLPKVDPMKKQNMDLFRRHFDVVVFVILLFLFYVQWIAMLANSGHKFDMSSAIIPAMGALFLVIGAVVRHVEPNWFMGIRTPWTLSNKTVWTKTHQLGGTLFQMSGVLAFGGLIFESYALWFVVIPVVASALVSFIYSYIIYAK
ncbi:SdpI family protein [Candidatus Peregrinibacteria bacterium]|nr:MAG: SdpI family protein [Candidatus Peregrinibacteria bacterium]